MADRKISRILSPASTPGFLGQGHIAIPVLDGLSFADTDPFILLMDDQLDLPGGKPVGGPHPHAGFETVTLVLEGDSSSKSKTLQTGGLEWMTAGSGIVHTEEIDSSVKMRILQLWLTLPKAKRWTKPKWQELHLDNVPIYKVGASEVRVYSGKSQGLTAPTQNETPTTIVDFQLEAGQELSQEIPATYNGFIYVIEGSITVGTQNTVLPKGNVALMEKSVDNSLSQIRFKANSQGARFILYAGEPQNVPIVSHGPFIGDSQEDIIRLYTEYRQGGMGHVHDLPDDQKFRYLQSQ